MMDIVAAVVCVVCFTAFVLIINMKPGDSGEEQ